jgi:integrase/recombinase XerC
VADAVRPVGEDAELLARFLAFLGLEKRYSEATCRNYRHAIEHFIELLRVPADESGRILREAKNRDVRSYIIDAQRAGLSRRTLHLHLSALRSFYRYAREQGLLQDSPMSGISLPSFRKPLPKFLTESEMARFLKGPEALLAEGTIDAFAAARDGVIFELFYGAGLRISELVAARWAHMATGEGTLRVTGKGGKDRLCPIGQVALQKVLRFRDSFAVVKKPQDPLVHTAEGFPLTPHWIQKRMKVYLAEAGLPMDLTPHKLRHSFATHLINSGADMRVVQELLGHARLTTTQVYTHVGLKRLKETHRRRHPRG